MPHLTNDQVTSLAQTLVTLQGGTWTGQTAEEQAAAVQTVTKLFAAANSLVGPAVVPTVPGVSPVDAWRSRHGKKNTGGAPRGAPESVDVSPKASSAATSPSSGPAAPGGGTQTAAGSVVATGH